MSSKEDIAIKQKKVIVCGATFGQFYMEALSRLKDMYHLSGILARGSEKAVKCADFYGVNLYKNIEEIPEDIDMAIIIMRSGLLGGCGNDYVTHFLERGISVLQEFPVHPEDVNTFYKLAKKNNAKYFIGDFYMKLPQIKKLISIVKELNNICNPSHIQISCGTQVSFPAIMMIKEMLKTSRKLNMKPVTDNETPFQLLVGHADGVPITMEVHNEINPKDPDGNMYLLQAFTVFYENGRLVLSDPFSPIYWIPKINTSKQLYETGKIGSLKEESDFNTFNMLGDIETCSMGSMKTELWVKAICEDICQAYEKMNDDKKYLTGAQKNLTGVKQWNEINKMVGFAKHIQNYRTTKEQNEEINNVIKSYF